MTRFLAAFLLMAASAGAQTITTQGPGDGCAPGTDGTLHPHCLEIDMLRPGRIGVVEPVPAGWQAQPVDGLAPGATPLYALLSLVEEPFADEGAGDLQIHMAETGAAVDFLIRVTGRPDDSVAGMDLVGRLAPDATGRWAPIQLDRRYLCRRGVGDSGLCR